MEEVCEEEEEEEEEEEKKVEDEDQEGRKKMNTDNSGSHNHCRTGSREMQQVCLRYVMRGFMLNTGPKPTKMG